MYTPKLTDTDKHNLVVIKKNLRKVIEDNFESVYKFAQVSKLSSVNLYRWTDIDSSVSPSYQIFTAIAEYLPNINLSKVLSGNFQHSKTDTTLNVVKEDMANYRNPASIHFRLLETQQNMIERLNEENNRLTSEIKHIIKKDK